MPQNIYWPVFLEHFEGLVKGGEGDKLGEGAFLLNKIFWFYQYR